MSVPNWRRCSASSSEAPAQAGAQLQAEAEEDGRFQANHVQVLGDADLGFGFKIHVPLLAFADLGGRLAEAGEDAREQHRRHVQEQLVGPHQHHVAGEDGDVGVPLFVHGGLAAAQGGLVHQVVVEEGEVVEDFGGQGGLEDAAELVGEEVGTEQREQRADALAAQAHDVADGGVEGFRLPARNRVGRGRR